MFTIIVRDPYHELAAGFTPCAISVVVVGILLAT